MSATLDSLRRAVDAVPGGRPVVALRLGKSDEVLRKELGGAHTHKLGATDALAIAVLCCEADTPHAHDYASIVATECGGKFVPHDADAPVARSPVEKIASLMRETSDVTGAVLDAMSDGVVSDNELAVIEQEIAQAEDVLRKLRQAARAVNAAGKPAHERGRQLVGLPVIDMPAEAT